jgi:hypothetical protein
METWKSVGMPPKVYAVYEWDSEAGNECGLNRISRRAKGVRLCGRLSKNDSKEWLLSPDRQRSCNCFVEGVW